MRVARLNSLDFMATDKNVTKIVIWSLKIREKETCRNKETNKQRHNDFDIHNTATHCPTVYQVSTL